MPMMKCRECGKEMSSRALACPHCGVVLQGQPVVLVKRAVRISVFITFGLFGLVFILIVLGLAAGK